MRVVLALLLTAAVAAQEQKPAPNPASPQAAQPVFRAGTDLVRVDVTVTEHGDDAVTGLTKDDFEISEDDVPQAVETMKFVQVDGTRKSDLNEPLEIRSKEH